MLLTSSLTMALAVWAVQTNRRQLLTYFLAATVALGAAFLVVKGFEYYGDYQDGLMPFVPGNFKPEEWRRGDGHGQGEGADAEKGDATPVEAQHGSQLRPRQVPHADRNAAWRSPIR